MQNLPDNTLDSIVEKSKLIKYLKRQEIYRENDPVDKLYFIKQGEVEISK